MDSASPSARTSLTTDKQVPSVAEFAPPVSAVSSPKSADFGRFPAQQEVGHISQVGTHGRARRGVADTSAETFRSLPVADYLAPKERAVLALFTGPEVRLSRQQIAVVLPMPINGVCGRVDSLLAGKHLEECGDRIDPLTRKRQKLLQLPRGAQRDLLEKGSV